MNSLSQTFRFSASLVAGACLLSAGILSGCQSADTCCGSCEPASSSSFAAGPGGQLVSVHRTAGYAECPPDESCDRGEDIPGRSISAPPGTYVLGWNDAMTATVAKHQFVVERAEWFSGGDQLGSDGQRHLRQLAERLPMTVERVIVEAEPLRFEDREQTYEDAQQTTKELNEQRRNQIVAGLTKLGVTDVESRVFIEPLDRIGVRGIEARRVFLRGIGGGRGGQGGGGGLGGGGQGGGGGGFGGGGGGGFGGGFGGGGGGLF